MVLIERFGTHRQNDRFLPFLGELDVKLDHCYSRHCLAIPFELFGHHGCCEVGATWHHRVSWDSHRLRLWSIHFNLDSGYSCRLGHRGSH